MEEEPKPKQPCKTCGPPAAWNPEQTRRDLFRNAAIAGIGLATASTFLTAPISANAASSFGFDIDECLSASDTQYEQCYAAMKAMPNSTPYEELLRDLARLDCAADKINREIECYAQLAIEIAKELADYAIRHPDTAEGQLIIIGGIALIVIAGVLVLA